MIDEVRIYNHKLSSGDVDSLYRTNLHKYARYDAGNSIYTPRRGFDSTETAPGFVQGISICLSGSVQDLGKLQTTTGTCLQIDTLPPSGSFTINT